MRRRERISVKREILNRLTEVGFLAKSRHCWSINNDMEVPERR
jgi:hypothetical protein